MTIRNSVKLLLMVCVENDYSRMTVRNSMKRLFMLCVENDSSRMRVKNSVKLLLMVCVEQGCGLETNVSDSRCDFQMSRSLLVSSLLE